MERRDRDEYINYSMHAIEHNYDKLTVGLTVGFMDGESVWGFMVGCIEGEALVTGALVIGDEVGSGVPCTD